MNDTAYKQKDQTLQTPTVDTPVSSPKKELGPQGVFIETPGQPEVPKELEHVMEEVHDEVEVPYEAKQAGLAPAKNEVPLEVGSTSQVQYTWSQTVAMMRSHINDARRWLAEFMQLNLKRAWRREKQSGHSSV